MRLDEGAARARLLANDHGVLCTVHPVRGVDAVPCVYAADEDGWVGIPVDEVKAKSQGRLQRERNLDIDPRATLLVEHWDRDDWSKLWWVRCDLRRAEDTDDRARALAARLATRFRQYQGAPFRRLLVLEVVGLTGWAA